MTLREAYWEALQRTGQICSPADQLPSEPFVMPGVSCKTMFNNHQARLGAVFGSTAFLKASGENLDRSDAANV